MYKITATFIVQQLATFSNYSQQPFLIINNKQLIIKCSRSLCNVLDHSVFSFTVYNTQDPSFSGQREFVKM